MSDNCVTVEAKIEYRPDEFEELMKEMAAADSNATALACLSTLRHIAILNQDNRIQILKGIEQWLDSFKVRVINPQEGPKQ